MAEFPDDKTEAAIRRKESAERLLNDPLLKEAFDAVERGIVAKVKSESLDDGDALRLATSLKLLGKVRAALLSYIGSGKLSLHLLREKQLKDMASTGAKEPV